MFPKLFDLTGKVALVTGGSKGLGKAMARMFAEAGANIVICSRKADELEAAQKEIQTGTAAKVVSRVVDMSHRDEVVALAKFALDTFGRVDILVNNAGSNAPEQVDAITDEKWDWLLELNLSSCMALTRALVPQMKEHRWGRIIHISSVMGLGAKSGRNAYCATKAALIGMTRASALDLGPFGITVNCIAPGPFMTDLPMSILSDEEKKTFSERTALGRWGAPSELAGPALMLASDAGSYVTGTTLIVDGGILVHTL